MLSVLLLLAAASAPELTADERCALIARTSQVVLAPADQAFLKSNCTCAGGDCAAKGSVRATALVKQRAEREKTTVPPGRTGDPPLAQGWKVHDFGWMRVSLPDTWARTGNCGPALEQQRCGPAAIAIEDLAEPHGGMVRFLADAEFVPDGAPEGGYTAWQVRRTGDHLTVFGSPVPARCPSTGARNAPCENPGGFSIVVLDRDKHWFYVLLGGHSKLTDRDLSTFGRIIESIRLDLDSLPAWDGGRSPPQHEK